MNKIEFAIGYYECAVFKNNELIYSFNDFSECFDSEIITESQVYYVVEELISEWEEDCKEHDIYFPLTKEEKAYLLRIMYNEFCQHYGVN